MLVSEAFNEYIEGHLKDKRSAPGTISKYEWARDLFLKYLGDMRLSRVNEKHITILRRKLIDDGKTQRQSNTVYFALSGLRSVLEYWAIHGKKCMHHKLIELPKFERKIQPVIYEDEVRKVIESVDGRNMIRDKLIISLFFSSGLRLSELASLNRDQIRDCQVTVKGKGGKIRPAFIDKRTNYLMEQYLETREDDCEALFVSQGGGRLSTNGIYSVIIKTRKRAGITKNVHPHTYRHGFATNHLLNGGQLPELRMMMGHADISTTVGYTHITDPILKKAYNKFHTF